MMNPKSHHLRSQVVFQLRTFRLKVFSGHMALRLWEAHDMKHQITTAATLYLDRKWH